MIGLLIRIAITVALFALIGRHVDLGAIGPTLAQATVAPLAAAVLLQFLGMMLGSFRWYTVMRKLRFGHRYPFYLRSFFKGMFFNQGLPTSIGGDALRILDVAREGHGKREAFYAVAVDRAIGLMSLMLLNGIAFVIWPQLLPAQVSQPVLLLLLLGGAGSIFFVYMHRLGLLDRFVVTRWLHELSERLGRVLGDFGGWGWHMGIGVAIHLFSVLAIFSIATAVGLQFDLSAFLVIFPLVVLLSVVPVSLAGWGVREGALIGLFLLLGAEQVRVLSMSVIYGLTLIVASLPGLFVYLTSRHKI